MATQEVLYEEGGWKVEKDGDTYTVSYRPPGRMSQDYEGSGKSTAEAFLDLPDPIRCLPAANRFLAAAKDARLVNVREIPDDEAEDDHTGTGGKVIYDDDDDEGEW